MNGFGDRGLLFRKEGQSWPGRSCAVFGDVGISLVGCGWPVFGDVSVSLAVAAAVFGDVAVFFHVACAVFGVHVVRESFFVAGVVFMFYRTLQRDPRYPISSSLPAARAKSRKIASLISVISLFSPSSFVIIWHIFDTPLAPWLKASAEHPGKAQGSHCLIGICRGQMRGHCFELFKGEFM